MMAYIIASDGCRARRIIFIFYSCVCLQLRIVGLHSMYVIHIDGTPHLKLSILSHAESTWNGALHEYRHFEMRITPRYGSIQGSFFQVSNTSIKYVLEETTMRGDFSKY
jgi:hypothetical protein